MLEQIVIEYGLNPEEITILPYGSGLINHTWKVSGKTDYLLQRINTAVFTEPELIDHNLSEMGNFLKNVAPDYFFVAPLKSINGQTMLCQNGDYYRLFPFVSESYSIDFVQNPEEAYVAAKQFGQFTRNLDGMKKSQLKEPLKDFHNLKLRVSQFEEALKNGNAERIKEAKTEIEAVSKLSYIAEQYNKIIEEGLLKKRVIHHDTKINNVLFNKNTGDGICVIDLDTVMPGFYISDVGDMMRTYLSEANEEEADLDKIKVRTEMFSAIYRGYMEEMGDVLSSAERDLFIFSGKFMIYMQALRFLTDHLNCDVYYGAKYPGHNFVRAKNQIKLLTEYISVEPILTEIIDESLKTAYQ